MSEPGKNWFQFGGFRLNTEEKILRRNDEIVPLAAKVIDVLCLLVAKRGEVVSKSELMETVWADSFVEESNLTQSIYSLRQALGNDVDGRPIIETLPKRGYRIATAVTSDFDRRASSPDIPDTTSNAPAKSPLNFRYRTAIFVVGLLAVLGVSAYFGSRYLSARSSPPVENVTFQKLTFSGEIAFPIISPDGRSIAYVQENRVFLQDVASGTSVKLEIPGHEKFGNLQFSNDSGSIIFRNEDSFDAGGDVFQTSRFGGPAKLIAERVWSTIGFAPDGRNVAFVRFLPTQGEWAVMIRDLSSGNERKLISRNLPFTIFRSGFPAWSPDGRKIAIIEQTPNSANISRLLLVDAATGDATTIKTEQLIQIEQVVWLPENSGLLVTGRENNRFFQLWRLNLPDGELRKITNDLNNYRSVSVSADGKNLVARQFTTFSHIWTMRADDTTEQKQLTFGNLNRDGGSGLEWTPDGNIVYATRITGNIDLWSLRPSDGLRKQLTDNSGTSNENPFVTADGRFVFFESTRSGKRHIWRIDIDGGNPTQITFDDSNPDFLPVVSADGGTLYFIQRNPRSNVLWRQSLADGSKEMLTQQGKLAPGSFLTISPDGRYLAFKSQKEDTDTDTADIIFFDLSDREGPRTVTIRSQNPGIVWSDGGRSFDYVDNQPDAARIWRQSFDGKSDKKLVLEIPKARIFSFAWSRDGKTLALGRGRTGNDAILLTGF
ncbi:MAG: PD40 domain-containing protein [Pyrinomonadaceae bacterium]|nr:PD40 domain-containing protein [Pyrinomonadaceae bacterium]